ncbi:MAG: hypothetical protein LBQ38_06410 [Spirochaetaceae bacterium]|jgi:fibronectin type 3 domain-containing protein|nr:hypothetical protein [Spirochaetaceae bacterium]
MKKAHPMAALPPLMLILILSLFVGCKELFHPSVTEIVNTPGGNNGTSLSAPTNVMATVTGHDVTITWNPVSNATGYEVYRGNSYAGVYTFLVGETLRPPFPDTGLPAGTYYYKVIAFNGTRESSQSAASNPVTVTGGSDGPPTLTVQVTGTTTSSVSLSWGSISSAAYYTVIRADSQYGSYSPRGTLTTTSYTDSGLHADTTYYYKVEALSASYDLITESSPVQATTQQPEPPPTLTVTVTGTTTSSVSLSWGSISTAYYYTVNRANSQYGPYSERSDYFTTTSYTDSGLQAGTTYYYTVEAVSSSYDFITESSPVQATTQQPEPPPTLTVTVTGTTTSSVSLSWGSISTAYYYNVSRADSQYGSYSVRGSYLGTTSYTDSGLSAGTTYYYKVEAVSSSYTTITESSPVQATTQSNDGPTGGISNGSFSAVAGSEPWTLQTDGSRKSPAIGDSGVTKTRFSFTASAGAVLHINLTVSSEDGYDYAFIGPLDTSATYDSYSNLASISGTDSRTVTVNISTAGTHWIEIGYRKDSTTSGGSDCAWVEIMEAQGI